MFTPDGKNILIRKITLIRDDLELLKKYQTMSLNEIASDFVAHTVVERILERIINHSIDINTFILARAKTVKTFQTYAETYLRLADINVLDFEFAQKIAKSVGLRNILVHEYENLDETKFHNAIRLTLEEYPKYLKAILNFLDKNS